MKRRLQFNDLSRGHLEVHRELEGPDGGIEQQRRFVALEKKYVQFDSWSEMPKPPLFEVGDYIGSRQYEVLRMLGHGGFGQVFVCKCTATGQERAVKVETRPGYLRGESDMYNALAGSSFIPDYFGAGLDTLPNWIAMSVEGDSLSTIRRSSRDGRLAPRRLLSIAFHSVRALQEIHSLGIIHRDIRTMNLCLRRTATKNPVVLIDFGLSARVLQEDGSCFYGSTKAFSNVSMASLDVRLGEAPRELDDLHSLAFVLLRLRGLWNHDKLKKKEAIEFRTQLRDNLDEFLVKDEDKFLLDPIRTILNLPSKVIPDHNKVLDSISGCADYSPDGWSYD